jgi:hypothetical protein
VSDRSGSVGSVGSDAATFHSGLVASMMALQRATDSSGVQLAGLRLNTTRAFAFQPGEWQFMRVKLPQVCALLCSALLCLCSAVRYSLRCFRTSCALFALTSESAWVCVRACVSSLCRCRRQR